MTISSLWNFAVSLVLRTVGVVGGNEIVAVSTMAVIVDGAGVLGNVGGGTPPLPGIEGARGRSLETILIIIMVGVVVVVNMTHTIPLSQTTTACTPEGSLSTEWEGCLLRWGPLVHAHLEEGGYWNPLIHSPRLLMVLLLVLRLVPPPEGVMVPPLKATAGGILG